MALKEQLKKMILETLPDVDCVIGWGAGPDPLRGSPYFMRNAEDVEAFMYGPLAVQNPALYLPEYKGKKVGIVVKGCDSKSVVQLISENLVNRDEVVIIGFPCDGVVDTNKIAKKLESYGELGEVTSAEVSDTSIKASIAGQQVEIPLAEVMAEKCGRCKTPNAVLYDKFAGIAKDASGVSDNFEDLAALEAMSLEERLAFWEKEMSRCIRCYACRNACPLCVCRDHCVATSREPHWVTQADSVRDKLMFQVIHATHLAGRCTGCGECQRACPVGIPVLLLKRTLGRAVGQIFGFAAGMDTEATAPLLTFKVEEDNIKERDW
ncbi:4Fe-4S binding protein [Desulfovibrio sp. OttesenSCG-928-F07]|nr:4Fe-4S binding protein [Desulfovibrio sp. OttesenSCG-928-F07]